MQTPQNLCFFTSLLMWLASLWSLTQKRCDIAVDSYSPLRPQTKHLFRNWKSVTNNFSLKAFLFKNSEWVRLGFQFYYSPVFGGSSEELYHGFYRELLTKGKKMKWLECDVSKKSRNVSEINQLYFIFQCYSSHHHINGGVLLALVSICQFNFNNACV